MPDDNDDKDKPPLADLDLRTDLRRWLGTKIGAVPQALRDALEADPKKLIEEAQRQIEGNPKKGPEA